MMKALQFMTIGDSGIDMSEYERVIQSGLPPNPNFDNVIIGWKIYYNDGTIFSSLDGNWIDAPCDNVAIVLLFYRQTYPIYIDGQKKIHNYREIFDEGKYFWSKLVDGVPTFGQCDPTDDSLPSIIIEGEIKIWNGGDNFQNIYNLAYSDNVW